jgi:hypothetical protein
MDSARYEELKTEETETRIWRFGLAWGEEGGEGRGPHASADINLVGQSREGGDRRAEERDDDDQRGQTRFSFPITKGCHLSCHLKASLSHPTPTPTPTHPPSFRHGWSLVCRARPPR